MESLPRVKIILQKVRITLQNRILRPQKKICGYSVATYYCMDKQLLHLLLLPERHRDVSEGEDNVVAHHALVLALLRRVHPSKVSFNKKKNRKK